MKDWIIELCPEIAEWQAELIAEEAQKQVIAEREACAKVCEDGVNNAIDWDSSGWDQACENRAFAIRAREKA